MTPRRTPGRSLVIAVVLTLVAIGFALWLRGPGSSDEDASPRSVAGQPRRTAPLAGREVAATIGVATQNLFHYASFAATRHDMHRIMSNPAVDIIGWQESAAVRAWKRPERVQYFQRLYPRYRSRGWETAYFPDSQGTRENAISWRSSEFTLVDHDAWEMHPGAARSGSRGAFPPGAVTSVLLRHRSSGLTVRIVNTHLTAHIESGQAFVRGLHVRYAKQELAWLAGHWEELSGDVVVGTGDYNFDYRDDHEVRPAGGISRQFAGKAVSSYDALGVTGVYPTHGSRWIDYVFVAADDLADQRAQFATHRSLAGFVSDHRPLLARIRLYDATSGRMDR